MPFGSAPDPDWRVQAIRVVDVVALGPAMIYAAHQARSLHPALRAFLGISGVATIVFNGFNFIYAARSG